MLRIVVRGAHRVALGMQRHDGGNSCWGYRPGARCLQSYPGAARLPRVARGPRRTTVELPGHYWKRSGGQGRNRTTDTRIFSLFTRICRGMFLVPYQLLAALAISSEDRDSVSPRHNPGTLRLKGTRLWHRFKEALLLMEPDMLGRHCRVQVVIKTEIFSEPLRLTTLGAGDTVAVAPGCDRG
jgi:hypothetical protein